MHQSLTGGLDGWERTATLMTDASYPLLGRLRVALEVRVNQDEPDDPTLIRAAVALVVRFREPDSPEILLIRRAEYEGDPWSGHVAFPGGRMEAGDADLASTAVRETKEEISLDIAECGEIIGRLSDVIPRNPKLPHILIRPFVAVVDDNTAVLELSSEVAAAFWVPVSQLVDPLSRASSAITARGETFDVFGYRVGDHFVWGLTERILREFLELLNEGQSP